MASTQEKSQLFVIGCGYTGREILRQCLASPACSHHPLTGTAGSTGSLEKIRNLGASAFRLDLDTQPEMACPAGRWSMLYMVPPSRDATEDTRLARMLALASENPPERLVYISTSGVYGDRSGDLAREEDVIAPQTDRARRRADAESKVSSFAAEYGVQWVILRVPGIYGPGRLRLSAIRQAEPVLRAADCGPGNRIHRDDLATCCLCALRTANCDRIINVCDDEHATQCAFTMEVARQAGLPAPPQISLAEAHNRFSARRLSFLEASRRLDNSRMHRNLGVVLCYPAMSAGIAASLAGPEKENQP